MDAARTTDRPVRAKDPIVAVKDTGSNGHVLLAVLMIALLIPIQPYVGGTRLDPFRLVLLAVIVPFSLKLMAGRAGRFTASDGLMFAFAGWIIFTLVYHHGTERIPYAVIAATELLGGYVAGRILIRSGADYRTFIRYFVIALMVLFPFALFEVLTGRVLLSEFLQKVFPVIAKNYEFRHGFYRTQAVFPHPIHFGVFCAVGVANVFYVYRDRYFAMLPRLGLVSLAAMMSVSSAAFISIGMQLLMIAYGKVTGNRWFLLLATVTFIYVFLSVASNRGPMIIVIETLALEPQTAWWRVHILNYGMQNVYENPFLGLGLNTWKRPEWLAPTVDNFWLVIAMRHGFPGVMFLLAALGFHVWRIVRAKDLSPANADLRTGHMIALVALLFALTTVHAWDALAVFVMLYIGAGSVFYTGQVGMSSELSSAPVATASEARGVPAFQRESAGNQVERPATRYTRFSRNSAEADTLQDRRRPK